jgi:hypothetical protein
MPSSPRAVGVSTSSDSTASSLTKAEFINQGDAICKKGNEAVNSEAEEFAKESGIDTSKPTTAEQEEVVSEVVGPAIRQEAEEISALSAPGGDEKEVKSIVEAVEAGAEEAEESPSSLVEGETGGPFAEANKLAKEYGFKVCGGE